MSESTIHPLHPVEDKDENVYMAPQDREYLVSAVQRIEEKLDDNIKRSSINTKDIAVLQEQVKITPVHTKIINQLKEDLVILRTKYGLIAAIVIFLGTLIPNVVFHFLKIGGH